MNSKQLRNFASFPVSFSSLHSSSPIVSVDVFTQNFKFHKPFFLFLLPIFLDLQNLGFLVVLFLQLNPSFSKLQSTQLSCTPMSTSTEFLSGFKETSLSIMASTRRPWLQLLDLSALSFPSSLSDATTRITQNVTHFFFNYTLIILIILFLSLIYRPFSIIVLLIVFMGWYFLYFSRDEPLLDDRVVVVGLGIITVVALILTHVWLNVLVSLAIGVLVVCLHAAFRGTEDLVMDDQESPYGPMLSESTAGAYRPV